MSLFSECETSAVDQKSHTPLAWHLKPKTLDQYIGQSHLLAEGTPFRQLLESDRLGSVIFWGPPGSGKTALSRCIASHSSAHFISINAVLAKISDIKQAIETAKLYPKTILFIDEIHRFSKTQQDCLLPSVESGELILIGATTENPYFSVISGLCSRCQIYELHPHSLSDLALILERGFGYMCQKKPALSITDDAKTLCLNYASGDARKLLGVLDLAYQSEQHTFDTDFFEGLFHSKGVALNLDQHYDLASALIKSMRGSDLNATVYWLARLLKGGEDPRFIARRLVIFASEDVGLADPHALPLATACFNATETIGIPEVQINLSHVACYLAKAPKSNATYMAIKKAVSWIEEGHLYAVPKHLKDAHYSGAKKMGFGQDYVYPHGDPESAKGQRYLPEDCDFI